MWKDDYLSGMEKLSASDSCAPRPFAVWNKPGPCAALFLSNGQWG